ncbi:phosphotransferase [Aestuariimicrobium kwangyangense]|uniref:phosphotransferase n=1 Tax=Aestuariimicrobium kwangyangense TaxID=396389 RepID=UPI0003B65DE2|nr:phosphotransferase [Aestuariimicrobium kwangyangense]
MTPLPHPRYTRAKSDRDLGRRHTVNAAPTFDRAAVGAALEREYGVRVQSIAPIDEDADTKPRGSWPGHHPSTLVVRLADGRAWIARVRSSTADGLVLVQGDAEILRFLATHRYPAERLATPEPVVEVECATVLLTTMIPGGRPTDENGRALSPSVQRELGALLGRLHTLPVGGITPPDGPTRRGGAEDGDDGRHRGRPAQDLLAAMSFLVDAEDSVTAADRAGFDVLRHLVERADDGEGLPEALTHPNFHTWAVVGEPGDLRVVGWAGAALGPRLPALAWLLTTSSEMGDEHVEAAVEGYAEHVTLTEQERQRLAGVMAIKPLWLACLDFRQAVLAGGHPDLAQGWLGWRPERADRMAERALRLLPA